MHRIYKHYQRLEFIHPPTLIWKKLKQLVNLNNSNLWSDILSTKIEIERGDLDLHTSDEGGFSSSSLEWRNRRLKKARLKMIIRRRKRTSHQIPNSSVVCFSLAPPIPILITSESAAFFSIARPSLVFFAARYTYYICIYAWNQVLILLDWCWMYSVILSHCR